MPVVSIIIISCIAAAAALAVSFFVAGEFYKAAAMKGWPERKYFWIAFLLPLAGYILIAALPDRAVHGDMTAVNSADLPEI